MAENIKLEIDRGGTFRETVEYRDPDGAPIDLTGGSAFWTFKRELNDEEDPALTLSSGSGLVLGGALGTIAVTITKEQSFAMNGRYFHDLVFISAGGEADRLIEGVAEFKDGVWTPE